MQKKIGELFIDGGLITRNQLDMALKAQLIYGGHLGTCLIELGLIEEDALGRVLSEMSRVPYAPPPALQDVAEAAIHVLSPKLAEEYQAVPLKLAEKTLHITMVNPRNLQALDEMSFASGFRIVPWVSPELRIFQALERYYGVPRRLRYITICRILDKLDRVRGEERSRPPIPLGAIEDAPGIGEPLPHGLLRAVENARAIPPEIQARPELGEEYGYGRSWREIADQLDLETTSTREPSRLNEPRTNPKNEPPASTLDEVSARLCKAADKYEAVDVILDFAATRMERALLLGVQGASATVLDSRGRAFDRRNRTKATFHVTTEPLFELVPGDGYYRGPLPHDERLSGFFGILGMEAPQEILVAPVYLNDRLVALFYGDGGVAGRIAGETEEHLRLLRLFALALRLVLLKRKMQDVVELRAAPSRGEATGSSAAGA